MDWGNAIIRSISKDAAGVVTTIDANLHLANDSKATDKEVTWLSQATPAHALARVCLLDYDYLITKVDFEKTDNVTNVANSNTGFIVDALADLNVTSLKERDVIQFERKGLTLDKLTEDNEEKRLDFIRILRL